jgi:hypothetical protein
MMAGGGIEWALSSELGQRGPISPAIAVDDRRIIPREQVVRSPKCGARGQFGSSNGTLYTAPSVSSPTGATQGALLKSLIICNTDSSARTVTVYLVESGGSAAANRAILSGATVAANTTVIFTFPDDTCPLDSGETVQGLASSASVVTYRINVVELT